MLTVVNDPKAESAAMNLTLDPRVHMVLPDGLWLGAVKRATRRTDLLLYWHRRTGKFVVAAWLFPTRTRALPVVIELEVYDWHPDGLGIPIREMVTRLRMTGAGQIRHFRGRLMKARAARKAAREVDLEKKMSTIKHLKAKGDYQTAHLLESGVMPWVGPAGGGERLAETRDRLMGMLKNIHYG